MIKNAFYREQIREYELKNNSIYFGIDFFLQIQFAGLIEEHLDKIIPVQGLRFYVQFIIIYTILTL